jgi:hypothetical protein
MNLPELELEELEEELEALFPKRRDINPSDEVDSKELFGVEGGVFAPAKIVESTSLEFEEGD